MFKKIYAQNYDSMYANKNYSAEADFYCGLIKRYAPKNTRRVLSIGSGTINHERFLTKKGFFIDGIERSAEMILLARKKIKKEGIKNIRIIKKDMRSFTFSHKYDAALSMFNVVSYCKNLNEMEKVIRSVSKSLRQNGIFIFDCWNADAVLKNPPQNRWTYFKNGNRELYRLTEPTKPSLNGAFKLVIELIQIEKEQITGRETETHCVSAWKHSDLARILHKNSFKLLKIGQFMNFAKSISDAQWPMVVVAKKI